MDDPRFEGRELSIFSQFGEDGLIQAAFEIAKPVNRWCFEVGAADGREFSNTLLLREQGWDAVLIEANFPRFLELQKNFGEKAICVNEYVTDLDMTLSRTPIPARPDLGVIDVDGPDFALWSLMEAYRPRVLLIEFNPYDTDDRVYNPDLPRRGNQRGAHKYVANQTTKQPLIDLGRAKHYHCVAETFCNLLFIADEYDAGKV